MLGRLPLVEGGNNKGVGYRSLGVFHLLVIVWSSQLW